MRCPNRVTGCVVSNGLRPAFIPRVSALRLWRLECWAQEGPVEAADAAGLRAELPEFLGLRVLADGSAVVLVGGKAGEGEQRVGDVVGPFVRQVAAMVSTAETGD